MSDNAYKNNHYVPIWYQKRFVFDPNRDHKLHYLDLKPPKVSDSKGELHELNALRKAGFKNCFCEDDLYTTQIGNLHSRKIEEKFFGHIDTVGKKAVSYFNNFKYPWDGQHLSGDLVTYMSAQKLRTPKALHWLNRKYKPETKTELVHGMVQLRDLHCAIWTECIWLIADASESDTKFIVTDHPVTVYNKKCGPRSVIRNGDPDIWLNGTHTIFPLSLNKVLILTNLSWLRNPYQDPKSLRPNPNPFRSTIFKVTDIQTLRKLSEQEVREINFIMKSQAHHYIAAAKQDWLYPERYVSKSDWSNYGKGYLCMPDPRSVTYGGQLIIGNRDGTSTAYDEYGRRPWQAGFKGFDKSGVDDDWNTFQRFNGEFARLFGPYRRGRSFSHMQLDNEKDDAEFHQYHLEQEKLYKPKSRRKKG